MMSRSEWFWSEEGKRDRAVVREACHRSAPLSDGALGEEMAWLLYQQRVQIITQIERRFGVSEPHISAWRRAISGDLTSAFDFEQRDASVPSLPSTAAYAPPDDQRHASYYPVPPAAGSMPAQEPGVRPARPLPYDLRADAVLRNGTATITFASRGAAGAVFAFAGSA